MGIRVIPNGIEILSSENDVSVGGLLSYVETVIERLQRDLGPVEENFRLSFQSEFYPDKYPQHRITSNGFAVSRSRKVVNRILQESVNSTAHKISGKISVTLDIENE